MHANVKIRQNIVLKDLRFGNQNTHLSAYGASPIERSILSALIDQVAKIVVVVALAMPAVFVMYLVR